MRYTKQPMSRIERDVNDEVEIRSKSRRAIEVMRRKDTTNIVSARVIAYMRNLDRVHFAITKSVKNEIEHIFT